MWQQIGTNPLVQMENVPVVMGTFFYFGLSLPTAIVIEVFNISCFVYS